MSPVPWDYPNQQTIHINKNVSSPASFMQHYKSKAAVRRQEARLVEKKNERVPLAGHGHQTDSVLGVRLGLSAKDQVDGICLGLQTRRRVITAI